MKRSAARVLPLLTVATLLGTTALPAQGGGGWQAILNVDPLPSPYMSDWEIDPTIAQLILTNLTSTTTDVTMHYTLTRGSELLLRGVTDPQTIPAGASVVFDATSNIGGEADWNRDFERLVTETGRLPEGEYEGCVRIVDPNGFAVVERQCVRFATLYPDPPFLVFPMNGDSVTTTDPIFEWLPVQIPALDGVRVGYVLEIAEVNTEARQLPEVALESNIRQYVEPDLLATHHQYPLGALPLVPGRTYAWRVQALDGNGRPVSANQGRSEVWTFVYSEPEGEVERPVASIALTPERDTLRYQGDTARYEAKAFDADNVEIPGKRFAWRAADTTVAAVDSTGVVTGVGAGETQILASVDGITDSALSVTALPTGLTVGFERYDSQGETPSLLELITSGDYEEVVPQLMARLQSGEFRIPIPRLPGVPGQGGDRGSYDDAGQAGEASGGPYAQVPAGYRSQDETCSNVSVSAEAVADPGRKVFVVPFRMGEDASLVINECIQVNLDSVAVVDSTPVGGPPECEQGDTAQGGGPPGNAPGPCPPGGPRWDVDTTYEVTTDTTRDTTWIGAETSLFVVSWEHPGLPRVFVAFKPRGSEFAIPGTALRSRYWVINLMRSLTVESKLLPANFAGFFGDDSFDAGVGLTMYARRRCPDGPPLGLCGIFRRINPDNPEVTLHVFAGVTASETSVGRGDSGLQVGTSLALGFSIQASLPVRVLGYELAGLSLDSTQVGLLFAAQDSMVASTGPDDPHNLSVGVAPTLSAWLTGPRGNQWQVDGSIGVEWDPLGAQAWRPKLVVSAQLAQIWKLWVLRLGNPQLVFTTPIGDRDEREATELALSGTWGVGPNEGVGIAEGGGDVRGDIGGSAGGGGAGFEEAGRGQITFKWTRLPSARDSASAKETRDSAITAVTQHLHVVRAARERESSARTELERAAADSTSTLDQLTNLRDAHTEALRTFMEAEATLKRLREDRESAVRAVSGSPCWRTVRGRCLNWTASLSVGNGSLADFFAMVGRFLVGAL